MPKRKRNRVVIWGVTIFLGIVIAAQLAYPVDRGLPLAGLPGKSMAFATHAEMAKSLTDQIAATKLKFSIGADKSVEYPLGLAGAEPNTEQMIARLSEYPLWQRLIPGTLFRPVSLQFADVYYTKAPLQKFAEDRSKELSFAPQNARLAIKDGKVVATDAVAGSQVDSTVIMDVIARAEPLLGKTTTLNVASRRTNADKSANDLAPVQTKAEAALAHAITIKVESRTFSPDKAAVASWIVLTASADGGVTLSVDTDKVKSYMGDINKQVGTPAGQTNITLVDGREAARATGATGRSINSDQLAAQLAAGLLASPREIALAAQFSDVLPSVIYNSKYTATQAGLQAYVEDTARTKNMHIVIQQLDGEKWYAHARETESIPSASTFKLFIAKILFDKIDKGEIHWDDPILDTTVAGCFDRMTVASTNPCAEKWIADFGRDYINTYVYSLGFSTGTSFTASDAVHTTAADLTKFMVGLNDGTLVSGGNRDLLLSNLGRHPYRYGIPTGSAGQVNDKVGFLWDYVHDSAIVHHPKGTYIMTVMSKGQSYAAIAAVTRDVERIMYP